MFKNPEIPTDSGFTIWFNKRKKGVLCNTFNGL